MSATLSPEDQNKGWFGHPKQLARLFTTEMWERFGFYGMRALLTLYLAEHFLFRDSTTTSLYGGFAAMVYLTPLVGGLIADRVLGAKSSIKYGAILMSLGYLLLCFEGPRAQPFVVISGQHYAIQQEGMGENTKRYLVDGDKHLLIKGNNDGSVSFLDAKGHEARRVSQKEFNPGAERSSFYTGIMLLALSLIAVGNGFFKPNISTIVGNLYKPGDHRRDAGFTIFYMGINLGALLSQLICPWLAVAVGWWAGFSLAAIGMACSWALIQFSGTQLTHYGNPPPDVPNLWTRGTYVGGLIAVPIIWLLFLNLMDTPAEVAGIGFWGYIMALPLVGKILFGSFLVTVPGILVWAWFNGNRVEFQMMCAAMVLTVFNVVFWTLFEQAGSSLTLFAQRNTDLSVFGLFSITAGQVQFFNALFIVTIAPVLAVLWRSLDKRNLDPPIPFKFAIALLGAGAGFWFLIWGAQYANSQFQVGLWWLAGLYFIHSVAELCISPVGLSMITKLSITRVVGVMMGMWFLSTAVAQYVAGLLAQIASVKTVGGQVTNYEVSLNAYVHLFEVIGTGALIIGGVLLLLSPLIQRWMHGVK